MVVIAVRSDGPSKDFSFLAEPTLEKAAAATKGDRGASFSPLGEICKYALYGGGQSRGMSFGESQDYSMSMLQWRTHTNRKPAGQ